VSIVQLSAEVTARRSGSGAIRHLESSDEVRRRRSSEAGRIHPSRRLLIRRSNLAPPKRREVPKFRCSVSPDASPELVPNQRLVDGCLGGGGTGRSCCSRAGPTSQASQISGRRETPRDGHEPSAKERHRPPTPVRDVHTTLVPGCFMQPLPGLPGRRERSLILVISCMSARRRADFRAVGSHTRPCGRS
jgi:hypothetical protein